MNIFYLDNSPRLCAQMHNDKHVVKMILEYAQLLSTAHRILDGVEHIGISKAGRKQKRYVLPDCRESVLYSATHINHPSAVWVRKSDKNYNWLYNMWYELMNEYTHRYGKVHAAHRLIESLSKLPTNIPNGSFTEPTPAMPDEYKLNNNVMISYHNYYVGSKRGMSRWTYRPMPQWFLNLINTKYDEDCYVFTDKKGRIVSTSSMNM